mmetsp:Transcript_19659/g.28901  ORF Transcript_19659/g.28901 Transcript_19659/m.28901 type:complete len:223 (-) Transcript_19659:547-1215(-)
MNSLTFLLGFHDVLWNSSTVATRSCPSCSTIVFFSLIFPFFALNSRVFIACATYLNRVRDSAFPPSGSTGGTRVALSPASFFALINSRHSLLTLTSVASSSMSSMKILLSIMCCASLLSLRMACLEMSSRSIKSSTATFIDAPFLISIVPSTNSPGSISSYEAYTSLTWALHFSSTYLATSSCTSFGFSCLILSSLCFSVIMPATRSAIMLYFFAITCTTYS